jgi:hypothetical protein
MSMLPADFPVQVLARQSLPTTVAPDQVPGGLPSESVSAAAQVPAVSPRAADVPDWAQDPVLSYAPTDAGHDRVQAPALSSTPTYAGHVPVQDHVLSPPTLTNTARTGSSDGACTKLPRLRHYLLRYQICLLGSRS